MPTLDNSLADQLVRLLFQIAKLVNVQPDYFFRGYTKDGWKGA
jgi:hypothetical protein